MGVLMIVPTLGRRPDLLRLALESIASQRVPDIDLVAVAPPGRGVEQLVAEFGGRHVADPPTGGQAGAINAGLAAARPGTRYVAWLCDDDLLAPGSLEASTAALNHDRDAVAVYGWCDYINAGGEVLFRSRAGRLAAIVLPWGPNLIPQPGSLMRLEDVIAVGGVDVTATVTMDLDLFLKLRRRGRLLALPRTLASFRWHDDSLTVSGERLSMRQADDVRMRHLSRPAARAYRLLRWPGRWALWLAKRNVDRKAARAARAGAGH